MKIFFNRKILSGIFLLTFLFLLIPPVLAADTGIVPCGHDGKACTLCDLIVGFKKLFDYGITTIIIICLVCATFAGVMYIVSSGNESGMESAKAFLRGSLIGLAIVLCAWVIVNTVITVLMPTQDDLGIGKKWYNFGDISCSSSTRGSVGDDPAAP